VSKCDDISSKTQKIGEFFPWKTRLQNQESATGDSILIFEVKILQKFTTKKSASKFGYITTYLQTTHQPLPTYYLSTCIYSPNINSVAIHPLLSHNRLPMDGALVASC
jgi:hypothetical protein